MPGLSPGPGVGLGLAPRGASYPLTQTPTAFGETGYNTVVSGHIYTSTFAEAIYDTTATSITINSDNDLYTDYPAFTELGLYVDGVYQKVSPGGLGAKANVVALSAGSKRLRIVNGLQSFASGSVRGTYLVNITANAGLAPITKTTANRLLFYGDSITVGGNATSPTGEAFPMIVRNATANSVAVEGWGSRSLYDDAVDGAARTAFVAKVVAYNPSSMWINMGHNDYFLDKWSSANFQTAYAALLVALNAALPSLVIYAQAPIFRSPEPVNGLGELLEAYRTAVSSAASGKAYVTFVDGKPYLAEFSLDDGVHPSTDGHYGIGQLINWQLGNVAIPTSGTITTNSGAAVTVATRPENGLQRVTKVSGGAAFNRGAVSAGYAGDVYLKLIRRQTGQDVIAGLNASDPTVDNDYVGIDYGFYFKAQNEIWENGASIAVVSGDVNTPWWIMRIGTTLTYRRGFNPATATVLRTVNSVSATLYFDCSLFQDTSYVDAAIYSSFV